jgi:two-component system capsular synthesis response regulator RcsB
MRDEKKIRSFKIATSGHSPIILDRVAKMLEEIEDVIFVGNANDFDAAIQLVERERPQVLIMEVHVGGRKPSEGVELLNFVKNHFPRLKVIVFTDMSDNWYRHLFEAFGADYFIDKMKDADLIPVAIKKIMRSAYGL